MKWQVVKMTSSQNSSLKKCQVSEMASRQNSKLKKCHGTISKQKNTTNEKITGTPAPSPHLKKLY
jgi:hypothetical protein